MPFAFDDGGLTWHFPSGLWPVYLSAGVVALCLIFFVMASVLGGPRDAMRRLRRGSVVIGLPFLLLGIGLYLYADSRYQDCLADGHHPWWAEHVIPEKGICDRAVIGDVLIRPPD